MPYTLALVIVRLLISPMHFIPAVHDSPELILLIFLPPLLFEAAWNLMLDHLRENLAPILTLAVPGVLMAVGVVGAGLRFGVGWPWPTSLLLGAIVSATGPVSALALFKSTACPNASTPLSKARASSTRHDGRGLQDHPLASVKKARLNELLHEGIITDDVHGEVSRLIDCELAAVANERSELKSESR